jgi:hypothetical protein
MDELDPPYYLRGVSLGNEYEHYNYFNINKIFESYRFLFFTVRLKNFRHLCYYDKKFKVTKVCDCRNDKEYYEVQTIYKVMPVFGDMRFEQELRTIGMVNDIDKFIPFGVGNKCLYINRNDELISYIQASDVERWFKMNPNKVKDLSENLKNFSQVKVTDNIIVLVVKLIE